MQDHMLHVIFRPSSIHRVFDCCPNLHGLQICHPLKTTLSPIEWVVERLANPLQQIQLMKCGIDLKQHRMSCPFLSSKPSSTVCLTEQVPCIVNIPLVVAEFTGRPFCTVQVVKCGIGDYTRPF
ncbi:hypothetical protein TNCV_2518241 [Trichonephila clavipes]|nr:hypothetical protein TNCV_2518241 [Trichonephila clavipes]